MLAPMEGVVDHTMRDMLTRRGGIDRCVTEFVRVINAELPNRVFYRLCPELHQHSKTPSGTPVYVQLLGGRAEVMAANAQRAAKLGAAGIDINFGCPAKTVNKNDGGSIILETPSRVFNIVSAVRAAVPKDTPVTAKIRLGYRDKSLALENALACESAGAKELVVHARTKLDGYKPPAYWEELRLINETLQIPVIANGEIWTKENYRRCIEQSGCTDIMLGRGLLSNPNLAKQIHGNSEHNEALLWLEILPMLIIFQQATINFSPPRYASNRIKQWLNYLRNTFPAAQVLFERIKRIKSAEEILRLLQSEVVLVNNK